MKATATSRTTPNKKTQQKPVSPLPKRHRTSLSAIRAKCLECSGNNAKEVDACPIEDCPLYTFRNTKAISLFYPNKKFTR